MTVGVKTPNVVVPLQSLFEVMSDGVLITDAAGHRTYANRTLNHLVGGDARLPLKSHEPPTWLPENLGDRYATYLRMAMAGNLEGDIVSLEWSITSGTGESVPVVLRLLPLGNGGNPTAVLWLVVTSSDAAAQASYLSDDRQRRLEQGIRRIAKEISRMGIAGEAFSVAAAADSLPELEKLSRRERQVLDHLLEGHRVVSIAEQLCVSEHTIRNHLKSIFRKLGVHSQAELVGLVRGNGVRRR